MSYFLNDEERRLFEFYDGLSKAEKENHNDEWCRVMFINVRYVAGTLGYARTCRLPQCRRSGTCRARSDLDSIRHGSRLEVFPPCAFPHEKRRPIRAYVNAMVEEMILNGSVDPDEDEN